MSELVAGANRALPDGAVTVRVPGPFDLSVLVTGDSGKVAGDGDFVFFNQPSAPGVRLNGDTVAVDPRRLRPGASRVTVVVSPTDAGTPLGTLPTPAMGVTGRGGTVLARFTPARTAGETVLLLAEIYRHGGGWKLRALGQGYADGLAGVARDFGVEVSDEGAPPPAPASAPPAPSARPRPAAPPPSASRTPAPPDGIVALINAERARTGVPPVTAEARLTAAAQAHAAGMAARDRLTTEDAQGPSVYQRVTASGYAYLTIAEHLVSGPRTSAAFVNYCLSDAESRLPLFHGELTQVGIGHAPNQSGREHWTALWASPFTAAGLVRTASEVVALTNTERSAAGLPPLAVDPHLTAAAQGHSADMVARNFYAHTAPDGSRARDRAAAAGYPHQGIGENIACGQRSPGEVVRGWMNSPGHRENILRPDYTRIGVGYATGGASPTYWTQVFGMSG